MDRTLDDTFYIAFTTKAFSTGVPTTLAGTPVVSAYEDGSLTQITAGITLGVDHDAVTGLNMLTIVATSANGYESGKDYNLVITTGTVDSVSVVGEVVGVFSLDQIAKAVWDRVLTGSTHNIPTSAGRRLRGIQENGSVYNGEVHVDTNNGVTGVVPYENGTSDNATLTWAEALAIAPNVNGGLSDFHLINGSSITFTSSMANKSLFGDNYSVALGGQICADVYIQGAAVSGVGTAATGEMHFQGCNFGTTSLQSGHLDVCAFSDTITATLTGGYQYHNCYSGVAGSGAPIFTKTAGQTITSEWRNWAGSIIVSTIESGDIMTVGGVLGTVTLNGADGTVEIRGSYKSIVDNRTGSPILNLDGAIQSDDLVDLVWDEVISKAAHNVPSSAAKILRQGGDLVQIDGAVADTTPLTTSFDTNLTQADGYFDDAVLIFTNGAANAGIGRPVSAYLNTDGNMTFDAPDDWPVTPVNGDDFVIFANHVHPTEQIADAVLDRDMSTGTDSGSPTVRTVRQALRPNRNKVTIAGGVMTVTKEDDATTSHTAAVTTTAGDPISGIDPT